MQNAKLKMQNFIKNTNDFKPSILHFVFYILHFSFPFTPSFAF